MVEIRVNPAVLVGDGDQLYSIANTLTSSIRTAASQLRGTDGMAGSDPVAEEYAEIYDTDAPKIVEGAWSLAEALRGLDSAVATTALGYDAAGGVGAGRQGSTIPVPQHGSLGSAPTVGQAMGAGVQGDFLGIDIGMVAEWVEDALAAIGIIIPNGDTGALATAASAWDGLQGDLESAATSVNGSFTATQSMDLPQSGDMLASRDAIGRMLTALAGNAGAMSQGCTGFIETIEQMRTDLAWMVGQLVAEVLIDIGLSVALGFLTAGIGAAAGAAKAATTIARWVQRIAELIVETAQKIRRLKLWMRGLIRAAAEGVQGAIVSVGVQAGVNHFRSGDPNYEPVDLLQVGVSSFVGGTAASPVGNIVAGSSGRVGREIAGGVAEGVTDGAASSAVDAMWEGKPWDPWQDMILGGLLGGALRPALSNLPSPSLGGTGGGNPSANAGTVGVPNISGADTSGGTPITPPAANAPSTQSNAPQPGVGTGGGGSQPAGGNGVNVPDNSAPQPGVGNGGGGGSQPAGGNGVNVPDNSAPQPGVGDGGSSQPAPSGAPEVPSGDVPTSDLPAGDTPTAPPTDAPSTEAPGTDAPASADPGTGESPSVDDILADVPSVDDILADAPSVDDILADVPSTDTIVDGAPTVDDIVADADAGTDPATDAPSQETPSPAPSSTEAPPAGGPDRDAFGIPVIDLPESPNALIVDSQTGNEGLTTNGTTPDTSAVGGGVASSSGRMPDLSAGTTDTELPSAAAGPDQTPQSGEGAAADADADAAPTVEQPLADGDGPSSSETPQTSNPLDDILPSGAEQGTPLTPELRNRLADEGYHLALFDRIQYGDYYDRPDPTLGREGSPFWSMPLEDGAHVASAADAARATGMSPATLRAMTGYEINPDTGNPMYDPENPDFFRVPDADRQIFGAIFRPDVDNPPIKPVEADAGGWAHFSEYAHDLGAGRTAVRTSMDSSGGYLVNTDVREYVTVGGRPLQSGDLIILIDGDGNWIIERIF